MIALGDKHIPAALLSTVTTRYGGVGLTRAGCNM